MPEQSKYSQRGVSSSKEDVHAAIKISIRIVSGAFCKIVRILSEEVINTAMLCMLMEPEQNPHWHMCTGRKPVICQYEGMPRRHSHEPMIFFVSEPGQYSDLSTIGRNKNLIPGEVITSIISGTEEIPC